MGEVERFFDNRPAGSYKRGKRIDVGYISITLREGEFEEENAHERNNSKLFITKVEDVRGEGRNSIIPNKQIVQPQP